MLLTIPGVLLYKFKGSANYPARLSKLVIDIPQVLPGTKIRPRFCDKHYEYQGLMRPTLPHRTRMARQDPGIRFDPNPGPGFPLSHRHDSGPGPHAASRATCETSRSSSGISERKKDPRVPCSLGSKRKSKPNFKPRK